MTARKPEELLLNKYLREIKHYNQLDRETEFEIFKKLSQAQDPERTKIIQEIACCNLRLVVSNAMAFRDRGVTFIDLIQQGNLGLMEAIIHFDFTYGWRFSSFAVWHIRRRILLELNFHRESLPYSINSTTNTKLIRVFRGLNTWRLLHGRDPKPEELYDFLSQQDLARGVKPITLKMIKRGLEVSKRQFIPLDEELNTNERTSPTWQSKLVDTNPYTDLAALARRRYTEVSATVEQIKAVIDQKTTPRNNLIMVNRLGLNGKAKSLRQIGLIVHLSGERVNQIIRQTCQEIEKDLGLSQKNIFQTVALWKTLRETLESKGFSPNSSAVSE